MAEEMATVHPLVPHRSRRAHDTFPRRVRDAEVIPLADYRAVIEDDWHPRAIFGPLRAGLATHREDREDEPQ